MATAAPEVAPPSTPNRRAPRRLGLTDGLLFLMALIWAVNYSVLKFGTRLIPPLAYNGIRIPLAAALQFGVARAMRLTPVARRDAVHLILLGMIGNGVYQIFFITGQARSRVATTVLMLASGPALAALLGRLLGSERLGQRAWSGIGLQLAGVGFVVLGTAGSRSGADSLWGAGLVFASAISWAIFSVRVKPLTERVAGLHVGAYTMLGGAIVSLAVGVPSMRSVPWSDVSLAVHAALAYSTVAAMVIAYLFWYHGVKTLGPTHTSMYSNMQPLLAMAVAWATLGEVPTTWQLVGAGCIMSGLLLARTAAHEPEGG
jgi:drug/metabolite transporter (DMT)-like permease